MISKGDVPKFLDAPLKGIPLYAVSLVNNSTGEVLMELHKVIGTSGLELMVPTGSPQYLFNDIFFARDSLKWLIDDVLQTEPCHLQVIDFYTKEIMYRSITLGEE